LGDWPRFSFHVPKAIWRNLPANLYRHTTYTLTQPSRSVRTEPYIELPIDTRYPSWAGPSAWSSLTVTIAMDRHLAFSHTFSHTAWRDCSVLWWIPLDNG
jgi:hypothetical protein